MIIKVKMLVFCENFMSTETFTHNNESVAYILFVCKGTLRWTLGSGWDILSWAVFPSSIDPNRASCQLVAKEWALNTGKLPLGCLPRINQMFTVDVKQQKQQIKLL